MRLEIELRCILFPLIIFQMFLQLDWSPPGVNSIDWTWFGKAHTCLRSHSWQCMSEQNPSHEVEGIVSRALRQNCVEAQIWWKAPKHFCRIEGPQGHIGPHQFLNGRSLEPPRLFLELAAQPNWAIGEKGLSRCLRKASVSDQVPNGHWQSSSVKMREPWRRTTISAALHQSGLYNRVARRNHSSVKGA